LVLEAEELVCQMLRATREELELVFLVLIVIDLIGVDINGTT
jgi:hypothetical protein